MSLDNLYQIPSTRQENLPFKFLDLRVWDIPILIKLLPLHFPIS